MEHSLKTKDKSKDYTKFTEKSVDPSKFEFISSKKNTYFIDQEHDGIYCQLVDRFKEPQTQLLMP